MGTERVNRPGKLVDAVRVVLYHPKWSLPCGVCEKWLYKDGVFKRDAAGEIEPRGQLPTPCGVCAKVPLHLRQIYPDETQRLRAAAHEFSPANRKFWEFYNRMKAVNWQDPAARDPLVQYMAGGVRELEDRHERDNQDRTHESNLFVLGLIAKRLVK